jgi:hypothetical protein
MNLKFEWQPEITFQRTNGTNRMIPGKVLSKMIKFRNEEIFQACVKLTRTSIAFLLACTNLNKLGIKVEAVGINVPTFGATVEYMVLKSSKQNGIQIFPADCFYNNSIVKLIP